MSVLNDRFVGGQGAVPYEWEPGIAYTGGIKTIEVQRIAGADRFEVSRNVALQEFPEGAKTVFDSETADVLRRLGATKIVIVGGTVGISAGIESQLKS